MEWRNYFIDPARAGYERPNLDDGYRTRRVIFGRMYEAAGELKTLKMVLKLKDRTNSFDILIKNGFASRFLVSLSYRSTGRISSFFLERART